MAITQRETKLMVVTGRKRVGKSNETLRYLFNYYSRGVNGRKVLIFDPNNEYGNYKLHDGNLVTDINIPMLAHNDIVKFNKQRMVEIRRIVPINRFGMPLDAEVQDDLIVKMMSEFRGGCIWIEDLNTVFGDSLPKKVSAFFTNNAHRDADIIIQMQSIGRVLPKMWQNAQIIRFHKQLDSVARSRDKLTEDLELFTLAEILVSHQYDEGNVRFFVFVDKEEKKIRGAFTKEMFNLAIMEYLSENTQLIKKEANKLDLATLKKKFTEAQALEHLREKLFKEYFGNIAK